MNLSLIFSKVKESNEEKICELEGLLSKAKAELAGSVLNTNLTARLACQSQSVESTQQKQSYGTEE
jgi:hypothetical protein